MGAQMGANALLFKQRGAGWENENCVGAETSKNTCARVRRIAPGVW